MDSHCKLSVVKETLYYGREIASEPEVIQFVDNVTSPNSRRGLLEVIEDRIKGGFVNSSITNFVLKVP